MKQEVIDYIKSIRVSEHPDGMALLQEGIEMGKKIKTGRSRFIRESNGKYNTHMDFKKECRKNGKIIWQILLGLATLDEQVEAMKKAYEWTQRTGLDITICQNIASCLVALPSDMWDQVPASTSYTMKGFEEYQRQIEAAPFEVVFGDHHIVVPSALETTKYLLELGVPRMGEFSQFTWGVPGWNDDMKRYSDMVRSMGMLASKRDEDFGFETYLDDGMPGYFVDCVGYIAYALLESYIADTLCGCHYTISYGGLLSDNDTRMAIAMALDKLFNNDDFLGLSYINSSTNMQWDHDLDGNYGFSAQEFLFEILVEKKYHLGCGINPVSITEHVRVPTIDELLNIVACGKRVEEKAEEWLPFMDFTYLEEMRDVLVEQGTIMYQNAMDAFVEAGVDIKDPLEMILTLKNFNPVKFEEYFHPRVVDGVVQPFYPTVLGKQTTEMTEDIIKDLKAQHLDNCLNGTKVVMGSGDTHTYGLRLVESVLRAAGADVIDAGVDMDAVDLIDLAEESDAKYVGVSVHNGQALPYGKQFLDICKKRNKEYCFFMGGKLNSLIEGFSEPQEVDGDLQKLGIHAQNDILLTVRQMRDSLL